MEHVKVTNNRLYKYRKLTGLSAKLTFLLHSHVPTVSSSHLHDLFYAKYFSCENISRLSFVFLDNTPGCD